MRTDIVLGAVMLALAVLGGIVSAHGSNKGWHKILYACGFMVLGIAGMWFVVRESNETAVANGNLNHSLDDLSKSSKEAARLQRLNADLQGKLLAQTDTISRLARENADLVTGGNSYPDIEPVLGKLDNLPGIPLTIIVHGKHDLLDVTIAVMSHMQDVTGSNPPKTASAEKFLEAWNAQRFANLPLASRSQATILPLRIDPVGARDVYRIATTCRNGIFTEQLVMKRADSGWATESETITNSAGKILEEWPKATARRPLH
jgi:hypothetical protein